MKTIGEGSKPKHRQVFEHLRAAILAGRYRPGQRVPSEAALVRRFGVSRPTVGRALRDLQSAGLLERRAGSGSYARDPHGLRGRLFGLLIPGLGNTEIFEPICAEIARQAEAHRFNLLWGHSPPEDAGDKNRLAEDLCRQYVAERVVGVFFAPVELVPGMDIVDARIAAALDEAGIAVVLLDRDLDAFPRRSKFDLVGIDNRRAGYRITEHLLNQGCRHVEFVCRPLSAPTVDQRIAGWREALAARGIRSRADWLRRGDPADASFVRGLVGGCHTASPAARRRRAPTPRRVSANNGSSRSHAEAFVCANDITAANLMRRLLDLGLHIPGDVRVVGIDDVKYSKPLSVPLTTMHQPCRELGAAAVRAMMERIAHREMPARDISIDCRLVVRASCGAAQRELEGRNGKARSGRRRQSAVASAVVVQRVFAARVKNAMLGKAAAKQV